MVVASGAIVFVVVVVPVVVLHNAQVRIAVLRVGAGQTLLLLCIVLLYNAVLDCARYSISRDT